MEISVRLKRCFFSRLDLLSGSILLSLPLDCAYSLSLSRLIRINYYKSNGVVLLKNPTPALSPFPKKCNVLHLLDHEGLE
jgi:hypothetical protein